MISKGLVITCSGIILGVSALTIVLVNRPSQAKTTTQENPKEKEDEKSKSGDEHKQEVATEGKSTVETTDKVEKEPEAAIENQISSRKGDESYTQNFFTNLPDNSLGNKFKDSLLGFEEKDEDAWNKKLNNWEYNIKEDKNHAPFIFKNKKASPTKDLLINKCKNNYKKTNWREVKQEITRNNLKKDQYMSMIWTYCGRQDKPMPDNWLKSLG